MNLKTHGDDMTLVNVPEERARQIGYDAGTQILEIVDASDHAWRFFEVPTEVGGAALGSRGSADALVQDLCARFQFASW